MVRLFQSAHYWLWASTNAQARGISVRPPLGVSAQPALSELRGLVLYYAPE